ncbi:bypass of stop codon 6 [Fusarium subglutinans]|uniref:Bypass of stop codon 6 n=1 Tax=Gibberella subglutinans TaxID=42677 RepID=A0A8H5KWN1_GIBSU|nr:bypass of stop codon 6 [Fusarium subglutinans]KAF5580061.1 bypass of stop codon 6 [Fusarium subglutinans]
MNLCLFPWSFHLSVFIAADTMRPGLYSCEPCLRKAIDWFPKKQIPEICIDEEDFNREEFLCEACDQVCFDYLEKKSYAGCDGGTQRMGSLLERFIKHIKVNRRMTKEAYNSHPKTIRLRKKARRAIASHSNRSDADTMKDHRAEHKRAVATNTLSTLIDISNSLRVIARATVNHEMPPRCGPEKMPEECLWEFPLDENEDEDEVN